MTLMERSLMQLIKSLRLLEEEHYNNKVINPIKQVIKELREVMGVERVKYDSIIYKKEV